MILVVAVLVAGLLVVLEYDERIAMPIWLVIIFGIYLAVRFDLVRLEYDATLHTKLIVFGRVIRQWPGEEFMGWGHPFAALFVSDGFNAITWSRDV